MKCVPLNYSSISGNTLQGACVQNVLFFKFVIRVTCGFPPGGIEMIVGSSGV